MAFHLRWSCAADTIQNNDAVNFQSKDTAQTDSQPWHVRLGRIAHDSPAPCSPFPRGSMTNHVDHGDTGRKCSEHRVQSVFSFSSTKFTNPHECGLVFSWCRFVPFVDNILLSFEIALTSDAFSPHPQRNQPGTGAFLRTDAMGRILTLSWILSSLGARSGV